jgi:hypothetical protein
MEIARNFKTLQDHGKGTEVLLNDISEKLKNELERLGLKPKLSVPIVSRSTRKRKRPCGSKLARMKCECGEELLWGVVNDDPSRMVGGDHKSQLFCTECGHEEYLAETTIEEVKRSRR